MFAGGCGQCKVSPDQTKALVFDSQAATVLIFDHVLLKCQPTALSCPSFPPYITFKTDS